MRPRRLPSVYPFFRAALLGVWVAVLPARAADAVPGLLTDWTLSSPARASAIDLERFPDESARQRLSWSPAPVESDGSLDLAGGRPPPAAGSVRIYARTTIRAAAPRSFALAFEFTGGLSLYLNGRLCYRGKRGAPPPGAARWQNLVPLPLAAGDNELLVACTPAAGGGAFAARDLDAISCHPALTELWELTGVLSAPESVAIDPERRVLYVSNFGSDRISQIDFDGRVIALAWATGLRRPTGLQLFRGKLYAVERPGVAAIDLATGRITDRWPIAGAGFANDLAFDPAGACWVTDSQDSHVYQLVAGRVVLQLRDPAVDRPNGIAADAAQVIVGGSADGTLRRIDPSSHQVTIFLSLGAGALIDGLVSDGRGGYLFSDYFGRIFHADAVGRVTRLLDRSGPRRFCADFGYDPAASLLVVPSLYDHRLTAYRVALQEL